MTSISNNQTRTYDRVKCIVFLKTNEAFGGLSNMAGGYPLIVNGVRILTSEALYQVCRFPLLPDVQRLIIEQKSPMSAKMKSKPHRKDSRADWDHVRVNIMRWCLRVKLAQNWNTFSKLLLSTGEKPIVEHSRKDDFWGAKPVDNQTLVGRNILGRLLMELREAIKSNEKDSLLQVQPVSIPDFLLYGRPIQKIIAKSCNVQIQVPKQLVVEKPPVAISNADLQASLFDAVPVKETPSTYITARQTNTSLLSDLKPYTEYKDSGSKWLGKVPLHWEVRNLRTLIRRRNERNRPDLPLLSVAREKGVFVRSLIDDENHNVVPEDLSNYKVAREGNLVINKMKAWQGSMGIAPCDGIVSPAYFVFDFDIANRKYGQSLLRSKPYVAHFAQASDGVRIGQWDLTVAGMRQIPVLLPSSDEQIMIVRFLNWANGRLEKAIRAKRKIIALLNEQKLAIIYHAVTCGLDHSVPLKPSGIPWLGDIPQHWNVRKLKFEVSFRGGGTPSKGNASYWNGVIPWVSPKDMKSDIIDDTKDHITERAIKESSSNLVPAGSVMMVVRSGILQRTIPIARCSREVAINQDMKALTSKGRIDMDYFVLFVRGCEKYLLREWTKQGATVESIEYQFQANSKILLPPIPEQKQIALHLGVDTKPLNTTISGLEREIELLREYRTRLVADVVTGKLDVREVSAQLHEEEMPEEIETSSEDEISDEEIAV